ncbi:hypothetical protein A0H81_10618 [Grifola frondosa]|nr:hypothetical protein A0H81_10618 [Grifola frondosa]
MSSGSSLSRRASLAGYFSNLPIRLCLAGLCLAGLCLAGLRSRKSTASPAHAQDSSSCTAYVVYQHPTIIRDADATANFP